MFLSKEDIAITESDVNIVLLKLLTKYINKSTILFTNCNLF
jgi:hypothetical protein